MSRFPSLSNSIAAGSLAALLALMAGCSSLENFVSGDKIDYKSGGTRTNGLEVPPDLTQLSRDARFQASSGGAVSAATYQSAASAPAAAAAAQTIAPTAIGEMRIVRQGNLRFLAVPQPAEQLWPQLQQFWKERGFTLIVDQPDAGVLETDWAENRAKLPNDIIRSTIGKVFDGLYSTGERDKFRMRVERTPANGSEVYITHRGVEEVYVGDRKETTTWTNRPADPGLEAEFLSRLMVKLGAKEEVAKAAVAAPGAAAAPARARVVAGEAAATLQVDDSFERAWRRVGLSLDRSGFTVEDRDRAQGLYFVRYVDSTATAKEPGFFSKLLSFGKKEDAAGPTRYRVLVKGSGEQSLVSVLNAQGGPENGEAGKRIVALLVDDLK